MKKEEFQKYFNVYTEQIPLLIKIKAYWALLHFIIIFPDICGALESPDGQAKGSRYKDWARRYVEDVFLSGEELYDIRCLLLHQGRTLGKLRYPNYKFGQPDLNGNSVHKNKLSDGSLVLDVYMLTNEILKGIDVWFDELSTDPRSIISINVQNNIKYISQKDISGKPFGNDIVGLNVSISASIPDNLNNPTDTHSSGKTN